MVKGRTKTASIWSVYREETKALWRGRFTFFGLAALFLFFVPLAAGLGATDGGLWAFLFFVYVVVPSSFGAFTALQFAGPRASRFVQAVFTTPVHRGTYLVAKLLVATTVGLLYMVAISPFLILYAWHVGIPDIYLSYLGAGLLMILFSVAYGGFLGITFTGRSTAAPVTLGVLPVFFVLAVPFLAIFGGTGSAWDGPITRLLHLAPQVNILDIIERQPRGLPDEPGIAAITFVGGLLIVLLIAVWIYLGQQSVEHWESRAPVRVFSVLLAVVALAAPALAPPMEYKQEMGVHEITVEGTGWLRGIAIVAPGATLDRGHISFDTWERNVRLTIGGAEKHDLLVILPVPRDHGPIRATVHATGAHGLIIKDADPITVPLDKAPYMWEDEIEARSVIARIPVRLDVEGANGLRDIQLAAEAHVSYTVRLPDGTTETFESDARTLLQAHVPGASSQLAFAGLPVPALLLTLGIVRLARRR